MRIIAGKFKGKKLVKLSNREIRPSSDRLRETVFNILEGGRYGKPIESEIIIDLFSGTGALGLEAFSRGNPNKVIFVDNSDDAIKQINFNIKLLKIQSHKTSTILKNAETWVNWNEQQSGLIFSDPPYYTDLSKTALTALAKVNAIKIGATIIIENSIKQDPPLIKNFKLIESRKIGKSNIHFLIFIKQLSSFK